MIVNHSKENRVGLISPILSKFDLKIYDTKKAIRRVIENLLPINLVSILREEYMKLVHIVDTDQNMWIDIDVFFQQSEMELTQWRSQIRKI